MDPIAYNLNQLTNEIDKQAKLACRKTSDINVLAVSKGHGIDKIQAAIQAGQYYFGENYVQEGINKIKQLTDHLLAKKLQWHFIGQLQRNKIKLIATYFDWVQTVSSIQAAQALNQYRQNIKKSLQVLIQVNLRSTGSSYGTEPVNVVPLAQELTVLPKLSLRGLMTMITATDDCIQQKEQFSLVHELFQTIKKQFPQIDTLSMGMSCDMHSAIAAGSTLIRIGTAIFGPRSYAPN